MLSTTASINIDLQRPSIIVIHAKQFDALSRFAEIHLFSCGEPWSIDKSNNDKKEYAYAVQYRKPDGTKGLYDKLPDGETDAVTESLAPSGETVLRVRFAPQMFTVAGNVKCSVAIMQTGDGTKLQTCSFDVLVAASEVSGDESKDYYKMVSLEGLQNQIGDLDNLTTTKKESLVVAINEVAGKADNAATAAATAQQTADNAATAAGNAATAAQNAQQTADQAATAAKNAVSGMDISRNTNGGYTAKWTENSKAKSANIVGGVGLAQVTEILSYDISTRLPKLLKSKLVGAPTYSVMIGDLIVYTGADFTVSLPSEEAGGVAKVTIAERNEVFRVVTVTEGGSENEGYIVERTGLILKDSQISATLDGTDVVTVRDALAYLQDLAKQYVVNMTKNADGTYTADKTFDALKAAHDAGKTVICSFRDLTRQWDGPVRLPLVYLGNTYMGFAAVVDQEQGNMVYLWAYINSGGMGHSATEIATKDTVSTMIAAAIGDTATALSDMDSVIGGAGA